MSSNFIPSLEISKTANATYLIMDGSEMYPIIEPVMFDVENLNETPHTEPSKKHVEYDLVVKGHGQDPLFFAYAFDSNETVPSVKEIKKQINHAFIRASNASTGAQFANTSSENASQTGEGNSAAQNIASEPKQSVWKQIKAELFKPKPNDTIAKKIVRWTGRAFAALFVMLVLGIGYLMYGGSGSSSNDTAMVKQGQQNQQVSEEFVRALSKDKGDSIDIESQTRLTNETLKSMGLDPSKSAEIGCLSVDEK